MKKKSISRLQGLTIWYRETFKSQYVIVAFIFLFGGAAIIIANAGIPLIDGYESIIEAFGISLFIGSLSVVIDRLVFTSKIHESHSLILDSIGIVDTGIEKVYSNGIDDFWPEIYNKVGPNDQLTVLETFVDISTHGTVYNQLKELDQRGTKIKFICLRHHKDTKDQVEIRSEMSREGKDYIINHKFFWDKISNLMREGNNVVAKEVTFIPSVAVYQIDYNLRRRPTEIYFTPIAGGDSDITHYFKIHSGRLDVPMARKIMDYLEICDKHSKEFKPDEWDERKGNNGALLD